MSFLEKLKQTDSAKPKKTLTLGAKKPKKDPFGPLKAAEDDSLIDGFEEAKEESIEKVQEEVEVKEEKAEAVEEAKETATEKETEVVEEAKEEPDKEPEATQASILEVVEKEKKADESDKTKSAKDKADKDTDADKSEDKAEEPKSETEEKQEPDVEEKPKRKTRARKTTKAKEEAKAVTEPVAKEVEVAPIEIPRTDIEYAEAVRAINSTFVDQQWQDYKTKIDEQLGTIVIDEDMAPVELNQVLGQLDALRQEIWLNLCDTKAMFDNLSSKEPEGLIERVKRISFADCHKNDMERRKVGILACMNYKAPNTKENINLYEVLEETRARYAFLKGVMESIDYKSKSLITISASLKLEKHHMNSQV